MGCATSQDAGEVRRINEPQNANLKQGDDTQASTQLDEEAQMEFSEQTIDREGNAKGKYDRKETRPEDDSAFFQVEEAGSGDEFMAVKPWIGALVKPSNPPQNNPNPPNVTLELEYVYGYRSIDSRMNLYYTSDSNKVVYMTAALGVVLDKTNNTQKFFGGGSAKDQTGHNDDITSLAICPKRELVVTGQVGKDPIICIWRADTCERVAQFKQGRDTRAVKAVSFNKDSTMIATVGADNDHSIFVFDVSGKPLGREKGGPDAILDVCWSPVANTFATAGQRGAGFYNMDGGYLQGGKGLFNGNKMVALCCVSYGPDGRCFTGSAEGSVLIWEGKSCMKAIQIGTGMINAICPTKDRILVGAGKTITVYDNSFTKVNDIALTSSPRAIDVNGDNILAGLRDGTIVEINNGKQQVLMESHSDGESWGLEIDPTTGYVITSGDDNKIMVWDPKARKCVTTGIVNKQAGIKKKIGGASTLSVFPPNQCARAVCINPKSGHIAVGTNNGELHIHSDVKSLNLTKSLIPAKEWIECMAYSPDGTKLAVGSHDNKIYIFNADTYQLIATCAKHNSFITSLDWSTDSKYIQSNCGAYEYLFFDASTGTQLTGGASQLKDEPWASFTCKLGWPVQGVFPSGTDGSHVNGVDRSKGKEVFATGDDFGLVNLYRNPCLTGAKPNSYRGHSEHVVRVRFDEEDGRLYSIGGYDRTVMQWKVKK